MKRKNTTDLDIWAAFPANPHDALPIRSHLRKPAKWEVLLYSVTVLLWCVASVLSVMHKYGAFTAFTFGSFVLCLRYCIYESRRKKRCAASLLGKVESFTRRRYLRRKAEYPVISFEVNKEKYLAYGKTPTHTSTLGNDEWVLYNPSAPDENCVAMDSKPVLALWITVISGAISIASLFLEVLF